MAKYDFQCTECSFTEEKDIPMNEIKEQSEKQTCSKCGAKQVRIWQTWAGTTLCSGMYGIDGNKGWTTSK